MRHPGLWWTVCLYMLWRNLAWLYGSSFFTMLAITGMPRKWEWQ